MQSGCSKESKDGCLFVQVSILWDDAHVYRMVIAECTRKRFQPCRLVSTFWEWFRVSAISDSSTSAISFKKTLVPSAPSYFSLHLILCQFDTRQKNQYSLKATPDFGVIYDSVAWRASQRGERYTHSRHRAQWDIALTLLQYSSSWRLLLHGGVRAVIWMKCLLSGLGIQWWVL